MNIFKRGLSAALVAVSMTLQLGAAVAGGIPVIDVSNLSQALIQVQHMVTQIEEMRNQLETARRQLDNMTGVRGMATLIDSAYDVAVAVDPDGILADEGLYNPDRYNFSGDLAALYNARNRNIATWLGQSRKSLEQATERFNELVQLVGEVNNTPEQKDVLDLQARISAEQAMLQNESLKLAMLQSQAQAQAAMQDQLMRQRMMESAGELPTFDW